MQSFIIGNGVLLAFLKVESILAPKPNNSGNLTSDAIAVTGIAFAFILMLSIGRYTRHLDNTRLRCVQLEKIFGGLLFHRIQTISTDKKQRLRSQHFLYLIALVFMLFWMYCLISLAGNL